MTSPDFRTATVEAPVNATIRVQSTCLWTLPCKILAVISQVAAALLIITVESLCMSVVVYPCVILLESVRSWPGP